MSEPEPYVAPLDAIIDKDDDIRALITGDDDEREAAAERLAAAESRLLEDARESGLIRDGANTADAVRDRLVQVRPDLVQRALAVHTDEPSE